MSDDLRAALNFLRKRLVGVPPNVDSEDVWMASMLDEAEAVGRAALAASDELNVACLSCGASVVDALAGACHECGAEDRHIGSQWLSMPPEQHPLRSTPEAE